MEMNESIIWCLQSNAAGLPAREGSLLFCHDLFPTTHFQNPPPAAFTSNGRKTDGAAVERRGNNAIW